MKFILTESKYRKILNSYFDKFGGKIDNDFISMFKVGEPAGMFDFEDAYKYLIEWRGEEESKELAKYLLLQNPHHILGFGGYDFFFEVTDIDNWDLDYREPRVVVKVKVDDLGGTVNLVSGQSNLSDALSDEIYGWEINDEVNWGINDYFKEIVMTKTGINVIFEDAKYTSKIEYNND
jgi:hypothetical protein